MIIAPAIFRDEEYAVPKQILEARGACVFTASTVPGEAMGKLGMKAEATLSVSDAAARAWDAVVFVGGAGGAVFFDDAASHQLASHTLSSGNVLSAICIAPSTLARAGLLEGVRATAFPSQEQDLVDHGALWTGDAVTISGRIITANGPEAAEEFGHAIGDLLGLPRS
jgi:protease I